MNNKYLLNFCSLPAHSLSGFWDPVLVGAIPFPANYHDVKAIALH